MWDGLEFGDVVTEPGFNNVGCYVIEGASM